MTPSTRTVIPPPTVERRKLVVGGKEATAGQFPWQVGLTRAARLNATSPWTYDYPTSLYGGEWNAEKGTGSYNVHPYTWAGHTCGGVILDAWWVLTAAHCVDYMNATHCPGCSGYEDSFNQSYPDTVVGVFRHDLSKGSDLQGLWDDGESLKNGAGSDHLGDAYEEFCSESIRAAEVILHPNYEPEAVRAFGIGSDVALIKLSQSITCVKLTTTEYIKLDDGDWLEGDADVKKTATASGWGVTTEDPIALMGQRAQNGPSWGPYPFSVRQQQDFGASPRQFGDPFIHSIGDDDPRFSEAHAGFPSSRNPNYPWGPNGVPHHPQKLRYYEVPIMPMGYCAQTYSCQDEVEGCRNDYAGGGQAPAGTCSGTLYGMFAQVCEILTSNGATTWNPISNSVCEDQKANPTLASQTPSNGGYTCKYGHDCTDCGARDPIADGLLDPRTMVCISDLRGDDASCVGDSGGPLIVYKGNRKVTSGVLSHGTANGWCKLK